MNQLTVMCTTRGERRLTGFRCQNAWMKSKLIFSCRMMHNLIKWVMSYFTYWLRGEGRTDGWTDSYNIMCTPAVRAILFKLLTHALQAPMRVNVMSDRFQHIWESRLRPGISQAALTLRAITNGSEHMFKGSSGMHVGGVFPMSSLLVRIALIPVVPGKMRRRKSFGHLSSPSRKTRLGSIHSERVGFWKLIPSIRLVSAVDGLGRLSLANRMLGFPQGALAHSPPWVGSQLTLKGSWGCWIAWMYVGLLDQMVWVLGC